MMGEGDDSSSLPSRSKWFVGLFFIACGYLVWLAGWLVGWLVGMCGYGTVSYILLGGVLYPLFFSLSFIHLGFGLY